MVFSQWFSRMHENRPFIIINTLKLSGNYIYQRL
jgi:hypothetical protein